jgi:hypothetical protein
MQRDNHAVSYLAVEALEAFFAHVGLEVRDLVDKRIARHEPLRDLIEIRGNLVTIDTVMSLSEALTEDVVSKLRSVTLAGLKRRAEATVEPVYYHGLYLNSVVTIKPHEDTEPFTPHRFALRNPFFKGTDGHGIRPEDEAELAAWEQDAVLVKVTQLPRVDISTS